MIVLGLDTSGTTSSAAVLGGPTRGFASSDVPRAHARVLPGLIEQAARSAGVALVDVAAVAVARGPGLFTGMRVGLVSAAVFGMARGIGVQGVSTLDAMAARVVGRYHPDRPFAVLLDGRRREVFAGSYDAAGEPNRPPSVLPIAEVGSLAEGLVFIDPAALAAYQLSGIALATDGLAIEVAQVASARWAAGVAAEPPTPLYLRQPDISPANPVRSVLGRS